MTEYRCCMCGAPAVAQITDGTFRVMGCAEHLDTTWASWRAQRAVTHPPRPPRNYS